MTIKEAAKKLHVEAHVLRYWEDELKLDIKRNAQGHRYYDDRDIRLFESVKAMKEEGLMLKDIRNAIIRAKRAKSEEDALDSTEEKNEGNAQTIDCAKTAQEETDNEDKPCKPEANIKRTSSVELRPVHTRIDEAEKELEHVKIEDEVTDVICDKCGRNMVIKYGPHGKFLGCPGFPECHNTKPYLEKIGVACPKCGKDVILKKTKKGRMFYGCEGYPECDFVSWQKPSDKKCPKCGGYMIEKGSKLVCADETCGYVESKNDKEQ